MSGGWDDGFLEELSGVNVRFDGAVGLDYVYNVYEHLKDQAGEKGGVVLKIYRCEDQYYFIPAELVEVVEVVWGGKMFMVHRISRWKVDGSWEMAFLEEASTRPAHYPIQGLLAINIL